MISSPTEAKYPALGGWTALELGDLLGAASTPLLPNTLKLPSFAAPTEPAVEATATAVTSARVHAVRNNSGVTAPASIDEVPLKPSDLLDRLADHQRSSVLRLWDRLPVHMRGIGFDLHGPGWSPEAIDRLADALCDFPDVIATPKADFGECDTKPSETLLPPGPRPVTSRTYRVNPVVQKKFDAGLDTYLAAGLIQHFTSL